MSTIAPEQVFVPPFRGVLPDLDPFLVGFDGLRDAENWVFNAQGHFVPRGGLSQLGDTITGEHILGFYQYVHQDGRRRLVAGTRTGWHQFLQPPYGNVFDDITGTALTGSTSDHVIFRHFQKAGATWLLGINGKNTMKKWDGLTATYADVSGTPPIARCMAINNDHVLLGNLKSGGTINPAAIDVSATQDFDSGWGTTLVAILPELEEIVAMLEIGNQITAIHGSNAIYFAIAQGTTSAPFRYEMRVPDAVGPASSKAVVNGKKGVQYILARDLSVAMFDGTRPQDMGAHIQAYLKEHASENYLNLCHGTFDHSEGKLYYFFIGRDAGEVWRGICIDTKRNNTLYPLKFKTAKVTASCSPYVQGEVTRVVTGDNAGKVYQDTGADDDGTVIPTMIETGLTPWSRRYRTLQEIEHGFLQVASSQNVTVRIGRTDHAEIRKLGLTIDELEGTIDELTGTIDELSGDKTLDVSTSPPYDTHHRLDARSFSLRYEADINVAGMRYRGASLTMVERGLR